MDFLNNLQAVNDVLSQRPLVKKRRRFTQEEDEIIKKSIVGDNKYQDWDKIAKNIPGKSVRQCRERYQYCLKPGLNKGKWTPEEDRIIAEMYSRYGSKWALMAKSLEGRANNDIKNRWNNHLRLQIKSQTTIPVTNNQNQNRLNMCLRHQIKPKLTTPIANQNQNNSLTQNQLTEQINNDSITDFDFDFFCKSDDFDFNQNEDIFPNNDIFDNQFNGFYNF